MKRASSPGNSSLLTTLATIAARLLNGSDSAADILAAISAAVATETTVATLATEATAATLALESGGNLAAINGKLADVSADIIAAGDMSGNIAAATYDLSTNAPGRRNGCLQLYSASDTRAGTITVKGSADGGTNFFALPIMNEVTGAVTAGTVAVTAAAALEVLIKLPECGLSDVSVEYADSTGGTGAGTLKASITMR